MKIDTSTRPYIQTARAKAAEETARRISDAFLARLLTQWYDEITLDSVAEDAGVTVQTVIRRFGNKEGLLAKSVQTMAEQINAQRAAPPGDISCLIDNLIADYERTGDTVIRLLALEPRHPALKEVLDFGRSEHRRWVSGGLKDSLDNLDAVAREQALDALVIATDVYTWKILRRDTEHSVDETKAIIKRLLQATIIEFSLTPQSGNEK